MARGDGRRREVKGRYAQSLPRRLRVWDGAIPACLGRRRWCRLIAESERRSGQAPQNRTVRCVLVDCDDELDRMTSFRVVFCLFPHRRLQP